MTPAVKLFSFATAVTAVFVAAFAVGDRVGPVSATTRHSGMGAMPGMDMAAPPNHPASPRLATVSSSTTSTTSPPGGLAVSSDGYTLALARTELPAGQASDFTFRILGPGRLPVTAFTSTHDKELHLIVVRRDLTGYQHLHPAKAPDGTWSMALTLPAPGAYKMFADFQPAGRTAPTVLAADVLAAGDFKPEVIPGPVATATVDGYQVAIAGQLIANKPSDLTLTVTTDGQPLTDLQPYLAAYGHLVALRVGDLAYLHVHPVAGGGGGPAIVFRAYVLTGGAYRLFLDFKHGDQVHTAEFTSVAAEGGP